MTEGLVCVVLQELRTPETDQVTGSGGEVWRGYSVYTSGYHSVDRLSDIDEFEESYKQTNTSQSSTPGDIHCEDYPAEEEEYVDEVVEVVEEDDDSTPHIISETSKTDSPISTGKISEKSNERQIEEELYSSQEEEDEMIEMFNQRETGGTSLADELALQIELESDKSRLQGEGAGVEGNLLQSEETNGGQTWDNKISEKTLQHSAGAELSCLSPVRSIQNKTDFGIVQGKLSQYFVRESQNIFYKKN